MNLDQSDETARETSVLMLTELAFTQLAWQDASLLFVRAASVSPWHSPKTKLLLFHGVSVRRGWKLGEEQVKWGEKGLVRKECAKQHLQRRRGDGCGCKREKAFPNNICTKCNICRRRARWEEDAVLDDLMMSGFTVAWGWANPVPGFLSYQTETVTTTGGRIENPAWIWPSRTGFTHPFYSASSTDSFMILKWGRGQNTCKRRASASVGGSAHSE